MYMCFKKATLKYEKKSFSQNCLVADMGRGWVTLGKKLIIAGDRDSSQLQHWGLFKGGAHFLSLLSLWDVLLVASVKNFTEKHSVVGKLASGPWS